MLGKLLFRKTAFGDLYLLDFRRTMTKDILAFSETAPLNGRLEFFFPPAATTRDDEFGLRRGRFPVPFFLLFSFPPSERASHPP